MHQNTGLNTLQAEKNLPLEIMPEAIFRFYEELNDLLPRHRQKTDFEVAFDGKRSVKDMIEALGVPPADVDLILVNGRSESNRDRLVAEISDILNEPGT